MEDLAAAVRLAVRALRQMADEAGIAAERANTMAADLALHMMRLARAATPVAASAPHRGGKLRYRLRQPPRIG